MKEKGQSQSGTGSITMGHQCTRMLALSLLLLVGRPSGRICNAFSNRVAAVDKPPPPARANKGGERRNANFLDWISDAPEEIRGWKSLGVAWGTMPSYVDGTLVRNGGGIWTEASSSASTESGEDNDDMYSHIFDGLAKIHSYRIRPSNDAGGGANAVVEHQARFLEGAWFKEYAASKKLPAGVTTGPVLDGNGEPKTCWWRTVSAVANMATIFDNTPVNIWDYRPGAPDEGKSITALTDAPPRTQIGLETMDTISTSTMNGFADNSKGYELLVTGEL